MIAWGRGWVMRPCASWRSGWSASPAPQTWWAASAAMSSPSSCPAPTAPAPAAVGARLPAPAATNPRTPRASGVGGRRGGDESAVILPRTNRAGAAEMARRLQDSVENEPLTAVPGRELRLAVSCGRASFPEDASDSGALMRHADGQMYAAKAARYGRGRGV